MMIWSSRARSRSFAPVVWCFLGRVVLSDAPQNHGSQRKGIHKRDCKVWGPQAPSPCNLKCPSIRKTDSRSIDYPPLRSRRLSWTPRERGRSSRSPRVPVFRTAEAAAVVSFIAAARHETRTRSPWYRTHHFDRRRSCARCLARSCTPRSDTAL